MSELTKLARKIKTAHTKLVTSYRATLLHAKTVGELLIQAKGLVKGGFVKWLAENTSFAQRTAYNYIAIAEGWAEIDAKADTTIPEALAVLTAKKKAEAPTAAATIEEPHQETEAEANIPMPISEGTYLPQAPSISSTTTEEHVQGGEEPTILAMPTTVSVPATVSTETIAQTSFDQHLEERMSAHGIQGTVSGLLALLEELGVDRSKLKVA